MNSYLRTRSLMIKCWGADDACVADRQGYHACESPQSLYLFFSGMRTKRNIAGFSTDMSNTPLEVYSLFSRTEVQVFMLSLTFGAMSTAFMVRLLNA